MKIEITVNGNKIEVVEDTTITELLQQLNIQTHALAVERNQVIIKQSAHSTCQLAAGDVLEIVTLVGGG